MLHLVLTVCADLLRKLPQLLLCLHPQVLNSLILLSTELLLDDRKLTLSVLVHALKLLFLDVLLVLELKEHLVQLHLLLLAHDGLVVAVGDPSKSRGVTSEARVVACANAWPSLEA